MDLRFGYEVSTPGAGPQPNKPNWRVPEFMVEDLRDWLQDYDSVNEVIDGEEFPAEKLARMLIQAMLVYNSTPPIAVELQIQSLEYRRIMQEQYLLILDIAAARALQSITFRLMRNHITYQDGNINKQINERWQYYERAITRLVGGQTGSDGSYARVKEFKLAMNVSFGMGVSLSPLSMWSYPYIGDYINVL